MSKNPLLSICIPTRNRAFYLDYCLQSILAQDFTDYEIIVAENSDPSERLETRKVLDLLDRSRIVYFEQPGVVSMTENYESALQRTRGDYCLCLGDDDGIVANSLGYVAEVLRTHRPMVLKSPSVSYFWPGSHWHPQTALYLATANPLMWVDSQSVLAKVAAFEMPYYFLPMIYYAFVHRSVIDGIAGAGGGFFGDTTSIDMHSGMIIAANTESFLICDQPFAIAGLSPKSNGTVFLEKQADTIADEYSKQHRLNEQYAKYKLPLNRSLEVLTLMELMRAMERFPAATAAIRLDKLECFRRCCGLTGTYQNDSAAAAIRQAVLQEFVAADSSTDWAVAFAELDPHGSQRLLYPKGELYSFMATKVLNHETIQCSDVMTASRAIRDLYAGIPLRLEPSGGSDGAGPMTRTPKERLRYLSRHPGKVLRLIFGKSRAENQA
jgi:hypothetical protein